MRPSIANACLVCVIIAASACAPASPPSTPNSAAVEAAAGSSSGAQPGIAGDRHPFTVDDMLAFQRIDDPSVSADGKLVAFTVSTPDLGANRMRKDVWVAATDGTFVRQLTSHPESDSAARFAPDGKSLYFVSARSGSAQVWRIAVDGGEATQVTSLPVDVEGVLPFPTGKRLLLVLRVYPDAPTLEESGKRAQAESKATAHVRAFDALPVRHWDMWDDSRRSHLFAWTDAHSEPVDLMRGLPYDAPPGPFGGLEQVAITPSGGEVVFTSKMVGREAAWSTNSDLWVVPADGSSKPRSLTSSNPAEDENPVFSPDGSKLAYLAMTRPGYESDRRRIVILDWKAKTSGVLTEAWDRSPEDLAWSADGKTVLASADHLGRRTLFGITVTGARVTPLIDHGSNASAASAGARRIVWLHDDLRSPVEVYASDADGRGARPITHLTDDRVRAVAWGEAAPFTFVGAKGDTVHAWIVHPPKAAAGARLPVAVLIHGGPQGSLGDHFHYRWNPEAYAGHGYATLMIDFHGSTGYGQAFTDAIRGDWGGGPFEDLMKGVDAALARYKELDPNRMAALGASYGGYMINWVNGKTDRFKALVCHDGIINSEMAYYETDEQWFPEWEQQAVPWENRDAYGKFSPLSLVKNWKTPTLVVHGARDYRVVETEGLAAFTALQRRGIPSRFLEFPEENHWVLKPADSKRWHEEVLGWIDKYTGK